MLNFLKVVAAFLLQLVAFIFLYLWLQDTSKENQIKENQEIENQLVIIIKGGISITFNLLKIRNLEPALK